MMFLYGNSLKRQRKIINKNNSNIYIEIGDSNAGGPVEEPVGFPSMYQSADRVQIYYKDEWLTDSDGAWELYSTRNPPGINRRPGYVPVIYSVGADQSLVYGLDNSNLRHDLRYVKFAIGGSTLIPISGADNDWYPEKTSATGEIFYKFARFFWFRAIRDIGFDGCNNPQVKGVVVRLGTNDCTTANWNEAAFIAAIPFFVSTLRILIGQADCPIYWVQVNVNLPSSPLGTWNSTNVGQCRTAISNCAAGGSTEISNFYVLNYDSDTMESDGVHYTPDSFISQGEDQADTFIALGD